ncbi:hypothetical protein MXB_1852, partial [Myxobolus squamalis]
SKLLCNGVHLCKQPVGDAVAYVKCFIVDESDSYGATTQRSRKSINRHFPSSVKASLFSCVTYRASNKGLVVLRMKSSVFIDVTFRVTPSPFLQCIIIMGFDPNSNVYGLMSTKDEYLYCEVVHSIIISLKYRLSLKLVLMDFEKALLNAIRYQFTSTRIVGCYFHFRQALHQKMIKLIIHQDATSLGVGSMTQLLTCSENSFEHTLSALENSLTFTSRHFETFWRYFKKHLMVRFPRKFWKNQLTDDSDGNAPTNNCLERYNCRLRERSMNAHPNIFAFIDVIKEEDQYFTNLTEGYDQEQYLTRSTFPIN